MSDDVIRGVEEKWRKARGGGQSLVGGEPPGGEHSRPVPASFDCYSLNF